MESVHEDCGDCLSPDFISQRPVASHNNWSIAETIAQPIEQVMNTSMELLNRGEDIDKMVESYTQRINVLNVEILELRMALKHEQHSMTVIREMNEKSDQELAKLIQQEREKNDKISHDYQLLLEDYNFLLGEYEEINVRKENELKTLLESMSDVKVRYAEVEEENEKLLSELVQCKVRIRIKMNCTCLIDAF
jgi:chromosome segregation ATPase